MIYSARIPLKVTAQIAGEELERIERERGEITPAIVLEESRPDGAPLHDCFEWDDTIAAEKYRLHQASVIICNVQVAVGKKQKVTRAFVNISDKRGVGQQGAYISIVTAMADDTTRNVVLQHALRELRYFMKKYRDYTELAEVFTVIEKVTKEA